MARIIYKYDRLPTESEIRELEVALLMDDGREYPSDKKKVVVADDAPNTLQEQIERIIGSYIFQQNMHKQGYETPDEFEDFEIDETDPLSGYEVQEMVEEYIPEEINSGNEQKNDMKAEPESSESNEKSEDTQPGREK